MATTTIDFGLDVADPQTWLPTVMRVGKYAVGTGSAAEQIIASGIIITGAIASSALTFGATLFLVFITLPFLAIGFLRLIPAVNDLWPRGGA